MANPKAERRIVLEQRLPLPLPRRRRPPARSADHNRASRNERRCIGAYKFKSARTMLHRRRDVTRYQRARAMTKHLESMYPFASPSFLIALVFRRRGNFMRHKSPGTCGCVRYRDHRSATCAPRQKRHSPTLAAGHGDEDERERAAQPPFCLAFAMISERKPEWA